MVDLGSINRPVANQFDWTSLLQLMQQRELNELRKQEAQIDLAQKRFNLEMDMATKADRIADIAATVTLKKQRILESEAEIRLADALAAKFRGLQSAIGENPTMDDLDGVSGALPEVNQKISGKIPRSMRGDFDKASPDLGVITGAIERKLARGDPDAMESVLLGLHPKLQPFFENSFYGKARTAADRMTTALKGELAAVPDSEWITRNLSGSPGTLIEATQAAINENRQRVQSFTSPIYSLPEYQSDRDSAMLQAADKNRELQRLLSEYEAGQQVLVNGSGAITQDEQEGLRKILQGRVTEVLRSVGPTTAIHELAGAIKQANFIPADVLAPVFEMAARSGDPSALLKASILYDEIEGRFEKQRLDPLYRELDKYGNLQTVLETMSGVRKAYGAAETAFLSDPERAAFYVKDVAAKTDNILDSMESAGREERVIALATGEEVPTQDEAIFTMARRLMGSNESIWSWGGGTVMDELDLNDSDEIPSGMIEFFAMRLGEYESVNNKSLQTKKATAATLKEYRRGSLSSSTEVTAFHPAKIAEDSYGLNGIPDDLALDVARWQLTKELWSIRTKDGEPARMTIDDVDIAPTFLDDGSLAYSAYAKTARGGLNPGDLVYTFQPHYGSEMLVTWNETNRFSGGEFMPDNIRGEATWNFSRRLHRGIDRFLGENSPRHVEKVRARREKRQREEDEWNVFLRAAGEMRFSPAELEDVPQ